MSVLVITDGSADNRTKKGGWAAIIRSATTLTEVTGFADETTSNRMELTAAIEGLRAVTTPSEITLVADSAYLLNTLKNKWYERWIEEGLDRPNMDLWHQLIGLMQFHDVTFCKVKGHSGDYWNDRADRLAALARQNQEATINTSDVPTERCTSFSLQSKRCKLHMGHSGIHVWGNKEAYDPDTQPHSLQRT